MSAQIFIGNNPIEKYAIVAENDGWRAKNTAVYLLNRYIEETCGVFLKREENDREYMLKIEEITEGVHDEYMRIRSEGNNVVISGGKRGIIYAVCEFLEKYVGVKRYALDEEVLPTQDVVIPTDIDFEKDGLSISKEGDFYLKEFLTEIRSCMARKYVTWKYSRWKIWSLLSKSMISILRL